jgi:CheY-like chemotaxis protein/HPt (histidine-containing phosphotransfer) domain-containing protein
VKGLGGAGADAWLRFEVRDTGIGLNVEQRGKLFQPFVQADTSTSRKYGGTGLGLSICHRLCVMMGGRIGVDSTLGEGSVFWFELPFGVSDPQPARPPVAIADARVAAVGFSGLERDALARLLAGAAIQDVTWVERETDADAGVAGRTVLVRVHAENTDALALARRIGDRDKVVLAAPRGLASTLSLVAGNGVFGALTLPIRRGRLWHMLAAAMGRAELKSRQAIELSDTIGWIPPDVEAARAQKALVLVAEDNATNQLVVRRLLGQRGYALEMAENGAVALERYRAGGHGLLLTDFHMPEMDGFQLTAAIREIEKVSGAHLPIVALTADALPGTEKLCLESGMDGYLTKPIDSRALTATLEHYLPQAAMLRRRADGPARTSTDLPPRPEINPDILDLGRMQETFGGIDGEALTFLTGFVDDVPRMIDAIKAGLDAEDRDQARHAAHALKGAARSAGANRLGQLAADMQDRLDDNDLQTAVFLVDALPPTYEELRAALDQLRGDAPQKR